MTEPKNEMPDKLWSMPPANDGSIFVTSALNEKSAAYQNIVSHIGLTKYLRAEPVEALLKQAREAMSAMVEVIDSLSLTCPTLAAKMTIAAIDKFLEGKE